MTIFDQWFKYGNCNPVHISTMTSRIPETLRTAVVEKWLLGYTRSEITIECGISGGAISSIVDEWRHSVGLDVATVLRDIAVTLKKLGMSPAQCAIGLRIGNLIDKMGLDDSSIESFLSEVYKRLQELGIAPKYVARYVEGLLSLFDNGDLNQEKTPIITLRNIDRIFEEKKQEKINLEEERKLCESKLHEARRKVYVIEKELENLVQQKRSVENDLEWTMELRDQLEKNGLAVYNISELVEGARFFKDRGHNVNEIWRTFSTYEQLQNAIIGQEYRVKTLMDRALQIEVENKVQEDLLQERRLKNTALVDLKRIGFGLAEFKILYNLINEFAIENGQHIEGGQAVRAFISHFENYHYDYSRLSKRVDELKFQESLINTLFAASSKLAEAVMSFLHKKGVTQDDIDFVVELLNDYPITVESPSTPSTSSPSPPSSLSKSASGTGWQDNTNLSTENQPYETEKLQ